ncbi:MAG: hypothetical protein IJA67_06990, partial [Oscillospiraceae bacterium]|nr:hypothetical protein [Oscillospiraceae bacterium]
TLPDGFTDAKLLHVTRGAGSGEIFVSIEAIYDGKKEYLTYGFFGTEAPSGVDVLDEVQVQRLMAAMKQISTTQITEYKFNIPLEDRLDYIVPASIYGEILPYVIPDRYAPYIQTNEYSPDGVGYVTFGVANDMKPSNVFSRCYTYRITQKGGYIVSVEEVETITKETVLQNGTPYSGNSAGRFTGVAYDRTRTATVSGNEISVGSYQSHTDAGGTYVGTYTYDAKTGDFFAELAFQYHDNGNFITNDPETISGKLYEYGGFVHFVCTSSNISTVNVNDTLPMTFFPVASNEEYQMTKYTETLTGDNGKTYQISFDLPAEWTYGSGGIFEDANGNKRIGNRVIAVDISKEDFVSSLEEMAERYHVDLDSPIKGTSDSGIAYMGYCFEGEREIPGDITGRYLYRFTYSDSISMHMDVWKRNAYDDDSFYEQFVLPIIQSVTIGEKGGQTDQILNTEELSTYSLIPSGTAGCIVSLTLPSTWKWDGSHFNEASVRIGVYSDQKRVSLYGALPTLQEFEATLRESTGRVYQMDSPITGKTDTGYSFTGYYGDEEMPKGEMSRRYLFYITADQGVYTLEIWQRLDFDGANFLAETVLPIVQSFAIQQTLPHQAILEDRSALYDTLSKKEMLLSDWLKNNEYAVSQYTVIDLDHDADLETVLWLTRGSDANAGFLILHSNAGKTNAHLLYYRQFADLKEDGTFSFSSGVSNHGFGEIRFTGEACSISRIAYCESEDNTTVFYYSERDSRSLTKAEYESWERAQSNKSDPVWYAWNANEEHSAQPIDFSSIGGDWYHSFNYEGWYAFYGLNFRSQTAEMQFDHGLYESEY